MTTEVVPTYVIRVRTPDGTMYVHIDELPDPLTEKMRPIAVRIGAGKPGTSVRAWAEALSNLVTKLLEQNFPLNEIISQLVGINSDKLVTSSGVPIRSGPDGLAQAFAIYNRTKLIEEYTSGRARIRPPFITRREHSELENGEPPISG